MITAFHLEDNTRRGIKGALNQLRRNRIRVEHLYCDAAAVRSVVYERCHGKIGWAGVERFIGGERTRLLCREGIPLPSERGYRRFTSDELQKRLCENAAVFLLNHSDADRVSVALMDDTGDHMSLCTYLADLTDRLCIVTRSPQLYLGEADRMLEEKGAVIRISKSCTPLKCADLIIAPARIERDLGCSPDAVILSAAEPTVAQNAPVIFDYSIELPQKYRSVKPDYLDEMYFAAAMYSLAGAHELGTSIFRRCTDGKTIHTRMSLLELLKNCCNP